MPAPKIPPLQNDMALLTEPFRTAAGRLALALAAAGLPLVVFETRRAIARQDWLAKKGYSRAPGVSGPHPWGLAADWVLDAKALFWRAAGEWPQNAWDTGFELHPGPKGAVQVMVRPKVADVWRKLGAAAIAEGLEWGGTNEGGWASHVPGAEFGWDPGHIQAGHWKVLTKGLPRPT